MPERLCCVCPQLRQGEPRIYDRPQVDEGCRSRLRALLGEVVEHYAVLTLEKGPGGGAKVSGSRTPPLPLSLNALDLTMPPHHGAVTEFRAPQYVLVEEIVEVWIPARPDQDEYRTEERALRWRKRTGELGPSGDQVGEPSAPTILDSWARDWQTYEWALLPAPTVPLLAAWLTERLDWACDTHPAIDDFAGQINDLAGRLRPGAPRAEFKLGVPCRECERLTLFVWPGGDYVECGSCPSLLTPIEYERWTSLLSSKEHQPWVREVVARTREDVTP